MQYDLFYRNAPTRASIMFPLCRTLFNWITIYTAYQRPNSLHHVAAPLPNAAARIHSSRRLQSPQRPYPPCHPTCASDSTASLTCRSPSPAWALSPWAQHSRPTLPPLVQGQLATGDRTCATTRRSHAAARLGRVATCLLASLSTPSYAPVSSSASTSLYFVQAQVDVALQSVCCKRLFQVF